MQETQVQSLGQEDLEKEMATHSGVLAWRIPGTGEPGAQMIKNLLAMQETWVQSLGWEDPLENLVATHSSILA